MKTNEARIDDITIGEEAMEQWVRPKLELGHIVPDFRLQTVDGKVISPTDFKERKNLVILFFNPRNRCELEMMAEVRRRYHEITDENAEVLGIATGPLDELKTCAATLNAPFPLLSDVQNEAICKYCVSESTVFVADRYGVLKFQGPMCQDVDGTLNAVISTLELIELECPECGVSSWPEA